MATLRITGQMLESHYLFISISDQRGSPIGGPKKSQTNGYRMYPMHSDRNSVLNHHHLSTGSSPGGFGSGHRSNSFDLGPRGQGHGGHHGPHGGSSHSKHRNRLSALGRLFKPWKWKRRKKSEKFEKTSKCKFLKKIVAKRNRKMLLYIYMYLVRSHELDVV